MTSTFTTIYVLEIEHYCRGMIRFILIQACGSSTLYKAPFITVFVQNRQGKTRLSKWYVPFDDDEKVLLQQRNSSCVPVLTAHV